MQMSILRHVVSQDGTQAESVKTSFLRQNPVQNSNTKLRVY